MNCSTFCKAIVLHEITLWFSVVLSFNFTEKDVKYDVWKMAIARSLDWTDERDDSQGTVPTQHTMALVSIL